MRKVQCITCAKLEDLGKTLAHAKEGFGKCPGDPSGVFVSLTYVRDCSKFEKVTAPRADREVALVWWNSAKG